MTSSDDNNPFSTLSDDVVLKIVFKLEDDPRHWSRLACVSPKFSSLIRSICWKTKCTQTIPTLVADLLSVDHHHSSGDEHASLYKLAVCCPGLVHAGVLLENSDFGLERELGPDENYREGKLFQSGQSHSTCTSHSSDCTSAASASASASAIDCSWSMYDDLYYDTVYNASESIEQTEIEPDVDDIKEELENEEVVVDDDVKSAPDLIVSKRRKISRSSRSHLASGGVWNLSREQGNKLLASRFRGDCLYICDWPGCVHIEEKRNYMLFRGIFKNFKKSRVWRTIKDGNRSKIDLNCAYCPSNQIWDLHSAFCLRPAYGFHDDGEPVVRAYVCENGHVSGAWTDWPLYS